MRSRRKITVVSAATTSTTNITGFFAISRGSSLAKAEIEAGPRICRSHMVADFVGLRGFAVSIGSAPKRSEQGMGGHGELLDHGAKRERRKEGEAADDQ